MIIDWRLTIVLAMQLTKSQIALIGVALAITFLFTLVFTGLIPGLQKPQGGGKEQIKAELSFWGLFDSQEAFPFSLLKTKYPDVRITYRRFEDTATYEAALLEALAVGSGPDMFAIENNALPRHLAKIVPLSKEKLTLLAFRELFPRVVEENFAPNGVIYALPLSLDTLALIYNQDLFNENALVAPPKTWEEFKQMVPKFTETAEGKIVRSAAAIGRGTGIHRAPDLISLLMLQAGARMVDAGFQRAAFNSKEGLNALTFTTQFADPTTSVYTWSPDLGYSLDAFANGKVAMIFGYAADLPLVRRRNAFLDFRIAGVPQPEKASLSVTYPRYLGYTVSRQSKYANLAWDIILELAANQTNASAYGVSTKKPPALKPLIEASLNDPDLAIFAKQALTARSWPQADPGRTDEILRDMLDRAATGVLKKEDALEQAAAQITRLMSQRLF